MLYISILIFFLSIFFFLYSILSILNKDQIKIKKRLNNLKHINMTNEKKLERESFFERIILPFYNDFSQTLLKITPRHKREMINKKLERAGLLKNINIEKWLFIRSIIILFSSLIIGIVSFLVEPNIMKSLVLIVLVIVSINVFLNFYLAKKIQDRKKKLLKDLPYTLDLITVSVEAGLSFDGAIARVISNINGDLCDEFAKSLKEIRMGIERKLALKNMSDRCELKEISMLITSLIQADELGVSLSRVLRIESANLREHRKQVSREKAMKAPIKMLFPLIFFIFPSIFIIILGPAVIKMINIFV
ncbi:tight adherence protein C [Clostridium cavendishii DSM 21758]|uniref:Tight adherence protein C n=1 Tax=Clostridium cavendishii DSM 21758 TaxID=1121302 RepID=A0A1M6FER4_9CLOT|nr:type II secretion system F family protein [Clostridium cavendishii]SHI96139.1 tight adherence protein C [Clostridium cavendishii DSM 21758]